jgi:hypothetical protein
MKEFLVIDYPNCITLAMDDNSAPKVYPPLQFILTEAELEDIYSALNFKVGEATTKTQMRLSKTENQPVTSEEVFDDCYLLSLPKGSLTTLLAEISSNTSTRYQSPGILVFGLERGRKSRT